MTGTAQTEASELAGTYGLQVVPIPTNRPMVREDNNDLIYKAQAAKFDAVVADIESRYEVGQPVLAGTASVEHSELLAQLLRGARRPPRGAQRQAARPGVRDHRPGRPPRGGDGGHQHGRPGRRHPAGRQPRAAGAAQRARARVRRRSPLGRRGPALERSRRGRLARARRAPQAPGGGLRPGRALRAAQRAAGRAGQAGRRRGGAGPRRRVRGGHRRRAATPRDRPRAHLRGERCRRERHRPRPRSAGPPRGRAPRRPRPARLLRAAEGPLRAGVPDRGPSGCATSGASTSWARNATSPDASTTSCAAAPAARATPARAASTSPSRTS